MQQLVRARSPGFQAEAAEYEVRNGRLYYDVEGTGADGLEVEFDITEVNGDWTIVETQRDIGPADTPGPVRAALARAVPAFGPARIIESDQGEGVVIYEFFGTSGAGEEIKVEIRYASGEADVLTEEWVH